MKTRTINMNTTCLHCVIGETVIAMKSMGLLRDPVETIMKLLQSAAEVIESAPADLRESLRARAHAALTDNCKVAREWFDKMAEAGEPQGRAH